MHDELIRGGQVAALLLWASPALAEDVEGHASTDLHRPVAHAPPPPEAVRRVVAELVEIARGPAVDARWVRDLWRPEALPLPPDPAWERRVVDALGPEGALGARLRDTDGVVTLAEGPDYARALIAGEPLLSVVVRTTDDGLPVIDRIEPTTCALCPEPARFVRDLLADVTERRSARGRLLPGIDLDVAPWLRDNPRVVPHHWLAALQLRNHAGGHLDWLLTGARVTHAEGDAVRVLLADGREETWTVRYADGQWKLAYDALPDDSPLRMSPAETEAWRTLDSQADAALHGWSPTWATTRDGAGMLVGDRAIGAAFDPRDGTLLVAVLDLDRTLAGVFRVDPERRRVTERIAVPAPGDGFPVPWQTWFERWHLKVSPDRRLAAMSAPGRVWRVDLSAGTTTLTWRGAGVTTLEWARHDEGDHLLLGTDRGEVIPLRPGASPFRLESVPLLAYPAHETVFTVTRDGHVDALTPEGASLARVRACPQDAVDAAPSPLGDEILVLCEAGSEVLGARVPLPLGTPTAIHGAASDLAGASYSPGGRWFTTGAAGDGDPVLLWDARETRPIATLGVRAVRRVAWSANAGRLLTVEADGRVWLWDLAAVRRERGL